LDSSIDSTNAFKHFVRIWATSILFSILSSFYWVGKIDTSYGLLCLISLLVASWSTFCKPNKFTAVFLAVSFLAQSIIALPYLPNHCWVLLFFNLVFCINLLKDLYFNHNPSFGLFGNTKRFTLWLLVAVYLFAFLSKLNHTYLDPRFSCALVFYDNIERFLPFLPRNQKFDRLLIYSSLAIEVLIPLLLLFKSSRALAIGLGLAFHFTLSWDLNKYFINFSGVMSCLLLLALPTDFFLFLQKQKNTWLKHPIVKRLAFSVELNTFPWLSFFIFSSLFTLGALSELNIYSAPIVFKLLRQLLWLLFILPLCLVFIAYISTEKSRDLKKSTQAFPLYELIILLAVLLNGLSPYLGLKTRTGFNMYSNFRVEAEHSNHLLVSQSLDLLSYLSDSVTLSENKDCVCRNHLCPDVRYPYAEVIRISLNCHNEELKFIRGQSVHTIPASTQKKRQQLVSNKLTWLEQKLLFFRPLGQEAERNCVW